MLYLHKVRILAIQLLALFTIWPKNCDSLIITSVLAGDKKFKTISFDTKFLKPLTFEKDMPLTEFRRHRTLRPPKFDIDVNIPIKLPLEDEYAKEEPKKPVESNIFFQSGEINEPSYERKPNYHPKNTGYQDEAYAAASNNFKQIDTFAHRQSDGSEISHQSKVSPTAFVENQDSLESRNYRSDVKDPFQSREKMQLAQEASELDYSRKSYGQTYQNGEEYNQEFVPGGFVNLQLSGPTGGPKPTYEDYDREKWAQQLSQAPGAMPYPILNYQQLQNFYGGLGTFTNGLAENRYEPMGLLDKLKSGISHFANKFHLGSFH